MREDFVPPVERELTAGEKLLWSGQPRRGIRLRGSDAFVIPFSVLWWDLQFSGSRWLSGRARPIFMMLWGIPFVLVGLYIVFGRFIVDARVRAKTFYGITTERIIIISGLFSREVKSLNLRTLTDVSLNERDDGSGTITFGPGSATGRWMFPGSWPGASRYALPAFEMIERAKAVYETIRQAQKVTA